MVSTCCSIGRWNVELHALLHHLDVVRSQFDTIRTRMSFPTPMRLKINEKSVSTVVGPLR